MNVKTIPSVKPSLIALLLTGAAMISYAPVAITQESEAETAVFSTGLRSGIDDADDDFFANDPDFTGNQNQDDAQDGDIADDDVDDNALFGEAGDQQVRTPISPVSPVSPVQEGNNSTIDDDPFGPTGFRLGTFTGNASLEQSIGYSSNLSGSSNSEGGMFSQTDVNLSLTSDWSRHQLQSNFFGSYRTPINSDEIDQPNALVDMALRLDLIDGYTATTRGYYNFSTQRFTSDTIVPGAIDTPTIQTYGGSLELQRTGRKLELTLRGSLDRTIYGEADLGSGVVQSQADQDNNLYQLSSRVSYGSSAALRPFVEGIAGWRVYDDKVDRNGNQRDSEIYELRGGVEIDLNEKLTGEVSLGYIVESFDDPALETLSGISLNGEIEWSPERDTIIRFTAGTQLNGSISANENGSLIYTAGADIERQVTARTSWNAYVDYEFNDNADRDTVYGAGLGVEYWLNRYSALTANFDYEVFQTDAPGDEFDETSARMGIRFQH